MAGQSKSGTCFFLSDDESAAGVGVQYAKGSARRVQRERRPPPGDPSWASTW